MGKKVSKVAITRLAEPLGAEVHFKGGYVMLDGIRVRSTLAYNRLSTRYKREIGSLSTLPPLPKRTVTEQSKVTKSERIKAMAQAAGVDVEIVSSYVKIQGKTYSFQKAYQKLYGIKRRKSNV